MPHILEVSLCLNFKKKYSLLVLKKEALFDESLGALCLAFYACRNLSYHVNCWCGAVVIATGIPALSRFVFFFLYLCHRTGHFILIFQWRTAAKQQYSLMMVPIMVSIDRVCASPLPSLTFVGALILAWFFNQSFSFQHLTDKTS